MNTSEQGKDAAPSPKLHGVDDTSTTVVITLSLVIQLPSVYIKDWEAEIMVDSGTSAWVGPCYCCGPAINMVIICSSGTFLPFGSVAGLNSTVYLSLCSLTLWPT